MGLAVQQPGDCPLSAEAPKKIVVPAHRAQLGARGELAISFQLTHRTVRSGVAVQRDCPRAALRAFELDSSGEESPSSASLYQFFHLSH